MLPDYSSMPSVRYPSDHDLLIRIDTKLDRALEDVRDLKERVDANEQWVAQQRGWLSGSKFTFWLLSVLPSSMVAYLLSRG